MSRLHRPARDNVFYAGCTLQLCDWDSVDAENNDVAAKLQVVHAIVRHPDEYHSSTGRDPQRLERDYEDMVRNYRRYV